jgi:hypothetical protein
MTANDHHTAIARSEHRIVGWLKRTNPITRHIALPKLVVGMLVDVEQCFSHRDVDELSATGALALYECGEQGCRGLHAGVHIAVAERVIGVSTAAHVTLMLGEPRFGIHHRRIRPPINPRAGRSVSAD